jgi:hypothetical protein
MDLTHIKCSPIEHKYKVKERVNETIDKYGGIDAALIHLKSELEEFENDWNLNSSDCLGHGITCNRLMIFFIENHLK